MVEIVEIEHLEVDRVRPGRAESLAPLHHFVGRTSGPVGAKFVDLTPDGPGPAGDLGFVGTAADDLGR